ncbi:unnamed protein product, partial [Musa textilis]
SREGSSWVIRERKKERKKKKKKKKKRKKIGAFRVLALIFSLRVKILKGKCSNPILHYLLYFSL